MTFTQVQILKAIIRGDITFTCRGIGRSLLYNGYADYLKNIIGKDTDRSIARDEYDSIFTYNMLTNNDYLKGEKLKERFEEMRRENEELFNREYECKF